MRKQPVVAARKGPLALGTGLVALDVVVTEGNDQPARYWAGGTCGNVLLALRYLGWQSAPVCRFREGEAATRVLSDLHHWRVSSDFITVTHDGSTPIIVQKIARNRAGEPYHAFSWRCPTCGTRLPGYKPVLASTAHDLADRLDQPKVFFFDRVSRGSLVLARAAAERGAVVIFEPSGIGNPTLFREAWEVAHVVKYSHERLHELPPDVESASGERLQVETLGPEGLRYRSRLPGCRLRSWQRLEAIPVEHMKDAAGAGDWCTAGIIHKLAQAGTKSLRHVDDAGLRDSIRYGQALAAWTCGFEGARGGMYSVARDSFESQVDRILHGGDLSRVADRRDELASVMAIDCLCPSCEVVSAPRVRRTFVRNGR
jgi:fructokinase